MKIHEVLARDPRSHALANSGQARITSDTDKRAIAELRAELETFVCDGQYGEAIGKILNSYLSNLDKPKQDAAWVSGFFGSGKSHLLKMLGHLWTDTAFPDGTTARSLVNDLPDDVRDRLRELDTRVKRSGLPAVAAAGTLPAGSSDLVKMTVLSVILSACDLPEQYPQASFCFWLKEHDYYDRVRGAVEAEGREWLKELHNLYVSGVIAKAVLACDPNFAHDEKEARQTIRGQFPKPSEDITTGEFLAMARKALATDGELPLTILVLDEVQQYIGNSTERAVAITEITEAIYTQLDSKVMLVASGQSALSATPLLQRLKDRYRIIAQLSDTDVEAVTRQVLLRKTPSSTDDIKTLLDQNSGEIDKHLEGTRISPRTEDRDTIIEDYPLLPTRRRFWEECYRAVDAEGTSSQLRSQLRILHDTLKVHADYELGTVIPADALFANLAPQLVNSGVLLNEIDLRIRQLDDGTEGGALRKRICGLVFLIGRLPREGGTDLGVRATARTIADLMIDNITGDSGPFRNQVQTELGKLAADSTLMIVGEEYRLQTTEGVEWERDYREKMATLSGNEPEIAHKREQLLGAAAQQNIGGLKLLQGESKEKRGVHLHSGPGEPSPVGDQVVVWVRDGWSIAQKEVEADARQRGQDDHIIHLFLPKKSGDDLAARIVAVEASRSVIDLKGIPSTNEGREARESMQSRHAAAQASLDELIRDIMIAARVFQGGGSEVFGESLAKKLDESAKASLARLFPQFGDGDHKSWGVAMKRAKEGSDEPLKIVGWDKASEDHPVVRRVMEQVGNGAKGNEVRRALQSSPYGWPKDAIDTALIALHRLGSIRVQLNGQPIAPGHLDQNKIPKADFCTEAVRLSAKEKLALRGLFQKAGLVVRTGEEEAKAGEFLAALTSLAGNAGGTPPLPACPSTTPIDDLRSLNGSEQLAQILANKDDFEKFITEWKETEQRITKRLPGWQHLEQMARYTASLPIHAELEPEITAIRENRSLLEKTDHVKPLVTKAGNALRSALTEQASAFQSAYDEALKTLENDASWKKLDEDAQKELLGRVGLVAPSTPVTTTDEDVLRELGQSTLDARMSAVAAVSNRLAQALAEAVKRLKPEAKRVSLRTATLEDEAAVKAWIKEQEAKLLEAVVKGPVIVG